MDSIFTEIFATLRDDATLQALVGTDGAARFHRSWPTGEVTADDDNPALVIISFEGLGGKETGDGQADEGLRAEIHPFVKHLGFGQSRLLAIRDRIDALLNLKSFQSATKRVDRLHTINEVLDLYDEDTDMDHGVMVYSAQKIYSI